MKDNKSVKHQDFKVGQGYGSSEKGSEEKEKSSQHQYGDNPLPPSGGSYQNQKNTNRKEKARQGK